LKKILILAAAAIVLALGIVAIASANAGPHGGYELNTDACAGCHRAHTAVSDRDTLLVAKDAYALCYACHGNGLTETNPFLGKLKSTPGVTLNAGGFIKLGGTADAKSMHQVEGVAAEGFVATAFGGATNAEGISGQLECTSCHDVHGSSNYRILRESGGFGSGGQSLTFVPNMVKAAGPEADPAAPHQYASGLNANYTAGMSWFCAVCHKTYLMKSRGASDNSDNTGANAYYPDTTGQILDAAANGANGYLWESNPLGGGYAEQTTTQYADAQVRYRHATSRTTSVYTTVDASGATVINYADSRQRPLRFAYTFDGTFPTVTSTKTGTASSNGAFVCTTCHFAHGTSAVPPGSRTRHKLDCRTVARSASRPEALSVARARRSRPTPARSCTTTTVACAIAATRRPSSIGPVFS
jgi:predicted CXXCH cytochrome family protein